MSAHITPLVLHAAIRTVPVRSIVNRLNRPLSVQFYVLVAVAAILLVVAWIAIARAYRQRYVPTVVFSADSLFDEVAVSHQLSADERRLLTGLAKALDLPSPAHLMVSPSRFRAAASRLLERAHPGDGPMRQQLQTLGRRLFGDHGLP